MYHAIVFLPLIGFLIAGLFGRLIGARGSEIVTTSLLIVAAILSWVAFPQVGFGGATTRIQVASWISSGELQVDWAFRIDTLTAVMLVVVNTVSSLVHLYSIGYMHEDPHRPRFFAYLSLFTFAMLMLVTADNLVQMFFGWEGVGLASYLLIGFWYQKPSANAAAMKAFIVNRVGDFGFLLGIFLIFVLFGAVTFDSIFPRVGEMVGKPFHFLGYDWNALTLTCLLLFMGAMGKSAQFLLHTWLPDAMEGPTPVSALIHAATMVTAGVFMVARLSPVFEYAPVALTVVVVIGATTAFFAATVGLVQNDIKRVIAYSTCSQLGYMFVALGVGNYGAGIFHLFTHAFFKALLFLGAGSVIHAMHHEQDMRYYGGLRKQIPFTFWAMMAGTLAITGVGVMNVFGFAGFYSKDSILEAAFASGTDMGGTAFWLGTIAALMTSFYSWRLMFLTFWGKPRWAASEHIQHAVHHGHDEPEEDNAAAQEDAGHEVTHHVPDPRHGEGTGGYHPHESPWTMLVPLTVLSVGAVLPGRLFIADFIHSASFWNGAIAYNTHLIEAMEHIPLWASLSATIAMLIGFAVALWAYIFDTSIPGKFVAQFRLVYLFVYNKWYFDQLYNVVFVKPAFWLGRQFWQKGDVGIIDRFGPDGVAWVTVQGAALAKRVQSGYLYSYALVMLLGLVAAISWVMVR